MLWVHVARLQVNTAQMLWSGMCEHDSCSRLTPPKHSCNIREQKSWTCPGWWGSDRKVAFATLFPAISLHTCAISRSEPLHRKRNVMASAS